MDHILVGFKDLPLVRSPLGGELSPLPQPGGGAVGPGVAQVIDLLLHTLHALAAHRQGHTHY